MSKLPLTSTSCRSMRYVCTVMLLASAIGSADVVVTAQRQRPDGAQAQADVPQQFEFLFRSFEQRARDFANLEDLWKGLPYDRISIERGGTGGCIVACASSTLTLYRATVSGIVVGPLDRSGRMVFPELRGRAELRTVAADMTLQPPAPAISDFEGSVDLYTFANLSYLLHRARFLQLPEEYDCSRCPADRPYVMLSVAAGGKTKTVTDYNVGRPVELWAIQQAFDSVSKSIQWTQK